ncbi:MAG TPA: helix-turn-helix transcriptional regulator [Cyclobacteriaceae bacterium]|nr:helix-turn-helix transcriptional regulator [Cyclobacteriaceae bacterium]
MQAQFDPALFNILVAVVVFQYLLIAGFLISLPTRNGLLAAFFILVALNLIDGVLMINGFYFDHLEFALLEDSLPLAYGPILYLYTLNVIRPDRKRTWQDLFHFIPMVVSLLLTIIFYTITSFKADILLSIVQRRIPVSAGLIISAAVFLHFFVYVGISFLKIRTYHLSLHDRYASLENVNVRWLEYTLRTLGITFVISWFVTSASFLGYQRASEAGLVVVVAMLLYYINKLVLKRMKDPRLFAAIDLSTSAKRYARQALSEVDLDNIGAKLRVAEQEKVHLNPELTIDALAEHIKIPTRLLSQFLNDVLQKSFFDYVNGLRIEDAKQILTESNDPKLTVQEVMYQVGFNSKSSFNTLFKQKTGYTPSVFRKMRSGS